MNLINMTLKLITNISHIPSGSFIYHSCIYLIYLNGSSPLCIVKKVALTKKNVQKEFYTVLDPKRAYGLEFFILFHLLSGNDKPILSREVNLFTQVPHEKYSFIL